MYKVTLEAAATLLWLATVLGCVVWMTDYAHRPGATSNAIECSSISRVSTSGESSLLVFVHPHCWCSWATFQQLERVLQDTDGIAQPAVQICVFVPVGNSSEDWMSSKLVLAFEQLPKATAFADEGGELARKYGALTSGAIRLFDENSNLKFRGGITASRGHEGDCLAANNLRLVLSSFATEQFEAPVFGCPLFEDSNR